MALRLTRLRLLTAFSLFLLLAGQAAAALHAFEHDAANPQGKPCASCIAAAQLASACADTGAAPAWPLAGAAFEPIATPGVASISVAGARNRGPPSTL